jgi:hypothetical protein
MNNFKQTKDYLTIDEERYYHFSLGGKWKATKWIVFEGVHYYNAFNSLIVSTDEE